MRGRVSIKDVAQEARTSIATVSNVFNRKKNVGEDMRRRVLDAAEKLGYRADPAARSLKGQKTDMFGVIVSDLSCIFFTPMLCALEETLHAHGRAAIICDAGNSPQRETDYIRMLTGRRVDGIIRMGICSRVCEAEYARVISEGTPVVSLEHDLTAFGADSILVNNRKCAYLAVSHLIELGCQRIAHISVSHPETGQTEAENILSSSVPDLAQERQAGYIQALVDAGLSVDESLLLQGDFSPISGFEAVNRLLHSGISFDGIFAANDQMAVGALRALRNAGISVPEKVKLVGFDNTFISSIVEPALTTVSVSARDMGIFAAQRMLLRLSDPQMEPARIPIEYELIIRRSTMASARTRWEMNNW